MPRKDNKSKNSKAKGPFGGGPNPNSAKIQARELDRQLDKAEKLWKQEDIEGALELVDTLIQRYPKEIRPLVLSATILSEVGETEEALERAETAGRLAPSDPLILTMLTDLYSANNRFASALQTMRRLRQEDRTGEYFDQKMQMQLLGTEEITRQQAVALEVPLVKLEKAMMLVEEGLAACEHEDFARGLASLQQASTMVPDWTTPRMHLSVFQYEAGQATEALATAKKITESEAIGAHSVDALGHLATLLAWNGQVEQARSLLPKIEKEFEKGAATLENSKVGQIIINIKSAFTRMAHVYAVLGQDQGVYDVLKRGQQGRLDYDNDDWRWMAIAAYNLGKFKEVEVYWQRFEPDSLTPFDLGLQDTIQRPRPADAPPLHLPYFESTDMVPMPVMSQLLVLKETAEDEDADEALENFEFDSEAVRASYAQLSQMYPIRQSLFQNANFGLQAAAQTNVGILGEIRTPEIVAELKDYATSYIAPDAARRYAVAFLKEWGELPQTGSIRFWLTETAEWRELDLAKDFAPLKEQEQRMMSEVLDFADY